MKLKISKVNLKENLKISENSLGMQTENPESWDSPIGGHNQMRMTMPLSHPQHLVPPFNNVPKKPQNPDS